MLRINRWRPMRCGSTSRVLVVHVINAKSWPGKRKRRKKQPAIDIMPNNTATWTNAASGSKINGDVCFEAVIALQAMVTLPATASKINEVRVSQ